MKTLFTKEEIMQRKGCYSEQQVLDLSFINNTEITIKTILTSSIPIKDKRWFVYNSCDLTSKEKQKLSLLLSWTVLPIFENKYPENTRVRECLEGTEKFIKGEITGEELLNLRQAAVAYAADYTNAPSAYVAASAADVAASYAYAYVAAYVAASASAAYAADAAAASKDITYTQKLQLVLLEYIK